jgi:N utilization substance protein B
MNDLRLSGVDPAARSRARRRALQALYAWEVSNTPMPRVIDQFEHEQEMSIADLDYFKAILVGIEHHLHELDDKLRPFLDREVAEVDLIERSVLRIASFELIHRIDVPYRVVINEAIECAKRFGTEHGHTYVNGVLDKMAEHCRSVEYGR